MKQYEYQEILIPLDQFMWSLNDRGRVGWQAIYINNDGRTVNGYKASNVIFMREIEELRNR